MRVVIQRVSEASVKIEGNIKASIQAGLLIFLGIEENDKEEDVEWLCRKIVNLRIFNDAEGVMNLSAMDVKGDILVISQFTLHSSTRKGNRPSYIKSAKPATAIPLYDAFIMTLEEMLSRKVFTGEFGADMKVSLVNDGPVTIIMDSKNKE